MIRDGLYRNVHEGLNTIIKNNYGWNMSNESLSEKTVDVCENSGWRVEENDDERLERLAVPWEFLK